MENKFKNYFDLKGSDQFKSKQILKNTNIYDDIKLQSPRVNL